MTDRFTEITELVESLGPLPELRTISALPWNWVIAAVEGQVV